MQYCCNNYTINYNECDKEYIDGLISYFENNKDRIFEFFGIKELSKKLGYVLIDLILNECKRLGFIEIYANCDQNNFGSNKLLSKNGSIVKTYKRNDGNISNRYVMKL